MEELEQLIQKAIQQDTNSKAYKQLFTNIMSLMQQSGRILKYYPCVDVDCYHNALLQTWEWLRKNLHNYKPEIANVYTWFNNKLEYKIRDEKTKKMNREQQIKPPFRHPKTGEWINPIDSIKDKNNQSEISERIDKFLEDNRQKLRTIHPRNCPEGNCHYLLEQRIFFETPWNVLAEKLNSNAKTLNTHYQKKCLPYFRRWLEEQGYEF